MNAIRTLLVAALAILTAPSAHAYRYAENERIQTFGAGKSAVVRYQHRLDFYALPGNMAVCRPTKKTDLAVCSGDKVVPLDSLKPSKTISFHHTFDIRPLALWDPREKPFLVCMTPLNDKSAERPGFNRSGLGLEQFCGILSTAGDVIYEFPIAQTIPTNAAVALGISDDGHRAAIVTGEAVRVNGEDGEYKDVGNLKEVWIWEFPDKLSKVPASKYHSPHWRNLLRDFASGKI